jgi:hypothetical protein
MSRSTEGIRELQAYLNEIKDLDDAAFAAAGGTDRAEAMLLLENLNSLLGEVDKVLAELDPRVD